MNNQDADYLVNAEGIISRSYERGKHNSEKPDIVSNLLGKVCRRL